MNQGVAGATAACPTLEITRLSEQEDQQIKKVLARLARSFSNGTITAADAALYLYIRHYTKYIYDTEPDNFIVGRP